MAVTAPDVFLVAVERALLACQATEGSQQSQAIDDPSQIDVRELARDLGTNLHSQCTKLSLATRPPRTDEAVTRCLADILGLLPLFVTLCTALRPDIHGVAVCDKIRNQSRYALIGLRSLAGVSVEEPSAETRLSKTGILWESCVELQNVQTVFSLVSAKVKESSLMIQDAVDDLESWSSGTLDFNLLDINDSSSEGEDEAFNSPNRTTSSNSASSDTTRRIAMLRRIQILLKAIDKRKVNDRSAITQLNDIYRTIAKLSVEVDDLAVEIQEEADSTFILELEKIVALRVEELLDTVPATVDDKAWSTWSHTFHEKWLQDVKAAAKNLAIQYYSEPPPHEVFLANNLIKLLPCVINGLAEHWSCFRDWRVHENSGVIRPDYDHLKGIYGNTIVTVTGVAPANTVEAMPFAQFLGNVQRGDHGYARDIHLAREFPASQFYSCPALFQDDWLNFKLECEKRDDYKFVYMGSDGTQTKLHKDVVASHSWSTNITGHKTWTLIPPSVSHLLFTFDHEEVVTDIYQTDPLTLARWPHLEQVRRAAITVHQKPGETIFVPSTWYHQVRNTGVTLSINHNWINAASLTSVFKNLAIEMELSAEAVNDLREDGIVTGSAFAQVVQELTLTNAGMNWATFFDLIIFRLAHEDTYIPQVLRPSSDYESNIIREICDKWNLLDDAKHLADVKEVVDQIQRLIR